MTQESAQFLLKIMKYAGLITLVVVLLGGPIISWPLLAIYNVSTPFIVFVVAYGIYSVILFIFFCNYLHKVARGYDKGSFAKYMREW